MRLPPPGRIQEDLGGRTIRTLPRRVGRPAAVPPLGAPDGHGSLQHGVGHHRERTPNVQLAPPPSDGFGPLRSATALAEATARGVELATITANDIDLDAGEVWIGGTVRTASRCGQLTDWGAMALQRRLAGACGGPLVYAGGDPAGGQVSTCRAIGVVLLRAGLVGEPDVRPASVAAWAGRGVFEKTGRIEVAAAAMGIRILDRAARLIGLTPAQS